MTKQAVATNRTMYYAPTIQHGRVIFKYSLVGKKKVPTILNTTPTIVHAHLKDSACSSAPNDKSDLKTLRSSYVACEFFHFLPKQVY